VSIERYIYVGVLLSNGRMHTTWLKETDPPNEQQLPVLLAALNPPEGATVFKTRQWCDVELARAWAERGLAQSYAEIDRLSPPEQQHAVARAWWCFSNACRAMNMRPFSSRLFYGATLKAYSGVLGEGGVGSGATDVMPEKPGDAVYGDTPIQYPSENWLRRVSYSGCPGGTAIREIQHRLAYDNFTGVVFEGGVSKAREFAATGPPTNIGFRDYDVNGIGQWDRWLVNVECPDYGAAQDYGDANIIPAVRWYMDIIWGCLEGMKRDPLRTMWEAYGDVMRRNLDVLIASGRVAPTPADQARLLEDMSEKFQNARELAAGERSDWILKIGGGAAAACIMYGGPYGWIAGIVVAAITAIAEGINYLVGYASAVGQVVDHLGRRPPFLEPFRFVDSGINEQDAIATLPMDVAKVMPLDANTDPTDSADPRKREENARRIKAAYESVGHVIGAVAPEPAAPPPPPPSEEPPPPPPPPPAARSWAEEMSLRTARPATQPPPPQQPPSQAIVYAPPTGIQALLAGVPKPVIAAGVAAGIAGLAYGVYSLFGGKPGGKDAAGRKERK
jgi:hypothetical protein